jgi:DNA polymerase I
MSVSINGIFASEIMKATSFDPKNFECVTTKKRLDAWLKTLSTSKSFCVDTETTGVDTMTCDLVGVALAVDSGGEIRSCYIPLMHHIGKQLDKTYVLDALRPALENVKQIKVLHNASFDIAVFTRNNIKLTNTWDTMFASYVLHGHTEQHGMDNLSWKYLKWRTVKFGDVVLTQLGMSDFRDVRLDVATNYAAEDTAVTLVLAKVFQHLLKERGLYAVFNNIDRHMPQVLADMKRNGVMVDASQLETLKTEWTAALVKIEAKAYEQAGGPFEITKPSCVSEVLLSRMNLEPISYTAGGKVQLNADVLKEYAKTVPVAQTILDHRKLSKYVSTYCDGLGKFIIPETQRIHGDLLGHRTSTGRLAGSKPSLQHVPSRTDDSEFGKEGTKLRRAFVASADKSLVVCDFSQIELRVAAHVSGDKVLTKAYFDGVDVHSLTAATVWGLDITNVPKPRREVAKTANFLVLFGGGYRLLAKVAKITEGDAYIFADEHREALSGLYHWKERLWDGARKNEYVSTEFGRRVYLPDINSRDKALRGGAERLAVSGAIQGTAADLMRKSMIEVNKIIGAYGGKLVSSVHDELVCEVDDDQAQEAATEVRRVMLSVEPKGGWRVPIDASKGVGKTWLDAK